MNNLANITPLTKEQIKSLTTTQLNDAFAVVFTAHKSDAKQLLAKFKGDTRNRFYDNAMKQLNDMLVTKCTEYLMEKQLREMRANMRNQLNK